MNAQKDRPKPDPHPHLIPSIPMVAGAKKHEWVRGMILERYSAMPAGTAIPPEIELAGVFGVSRVTVARALNDLVREGILARHQGRGTFISLRPKRVATQCVGVLYSHDASQPIIDPFYRSILAGIQDTLIAADYSMTLSGVRHSRLGNILTPEEATAKPVDGLIVINIMNPEYFVRLLRAGIPILGVEYHFEAEAPTDYVVQDCEASAFDVAKKLLAMGHRRIAFFGHATRNINPVMCPDQNSLERLAGLRRAFQSAGIAPSEDLFFQPPHPHWSSHEALLRHLFSLPLPPTAAFCEENGNLPDLAQFLRSQGREPHQFPLCVTSGADVQSELVRAAWRIVEDWTEMGRIAARRMLARLQQPALAPETIKLPWCLEVPAKK